MPDVGRVTGAPAKGYGVAGGFHVQLVPSVKRTAIGAQSTAAAFGCVFACLNWPPLFVVREIFAPGVNVPVTVCSSTATGCHLSSVNVKRNRTSFAGLSPVIVNAPPYHKVDL